jgi:2'-5' RNA ligase
MKPISGVERMRYMNQELLKAFTAAGYNCDPMFTPHVTLVKQKFGKGKEMGKLPSDWLKKFGKKYFGIQKICGIELLSMSKPLTEKGYYSCKEEVWFIENGDEGDHGEVME